MNLKMLWTWLNRAIQMLWLLSHRPRMAVAILLSKMRGDGHANLVLKWQMAVNAATSEMYLKRKLGGEEEEYKVLLVDQKSIRMKNIASMELYLSVQALVKSQKFT